MCKKHNIINKVWIGIGSNLLNPKQQVNEAILSLSNLPDTELILCSKFYKSRPLGYKNQPDFLNVVVALNTTLSPKLLLNNIQEIELQQGRIRDNRCGYYSRWQPRTLDLDILLFGKYIVCTPELMIPHYDMKNREFFIYPLFELDREIIFPNGEHIVDIISFIPKNGLTLW